MQSGQGHNQNLDTHGTPGQAEERGSGGQRDREQVIGNREQRNQSKTDAKTKSNTKPTARKSKEDAKQKAKKIFAAEKATLLPEYLQMISAKSPMHLAAGAKKDSQKLHQRLFPFRK